MKNKYNLISILILIFSTQVLSEDSKVYFCNESKHVTLTSDDGKITNYQPGSFTFKVENHNTYELVKMVGPIFGGKYHPLGPYTALDVRNNDIYELVAYTNGTDKRLMSYSKDDGEFQYSNHSSMGVRVVQATCSIISG